MEWIATFGWSDICVINSSLSEHNKRWMCTDTVLLSMITTCCFIFRIDSRKDRVGQVQLVLKNLCTGFEMHPIVFTLVFSFFFNDRLCGVIVFNQPHTSRLSHYCHWSMKSSYNGRVGDGNDNSEVYVTKDLWLYNLTRKKNAFRNHHSVDSSTEFHSFLHYKQ